MEIKWNGQTIENLLVGTYLNTLFVYFIKRERTFGGNGKMGKVYL